MPLFTWQPLTGAQGYYVLVARDPSFTNIVDYAFTKVPAYAPRTSTGTKSYPDELTSYYWAVLPASGADGSGVSANPLDGTPPAFQKQATPPDLVAPADGATSNGPTTFRWTLAEGARRYRLEVATDAAFSTVIDAKSTDSTAYTSTTTYPANKTLYWRVRADDGERHRLRRAHVVGYAHVPEAAPHSGAGSGQPDRRRAHPDVELELGARRGLLRRPRRGVGR